MHSRGGFGALLTMVGLVACGGSTSSTSPETSGQGSSGIVVENPSGSCVAPNSGARDGYHAPNGSQWLRDCQCPLAREYWRVFADAPDAAYIVPRPDGARELAHVCSNASDPLHATVTKYALCSPAASTEQVAKVNKIAPADALAITNQMHRALRFVALDEGIAPHPLPSDIVDACNLHASTNSADFEALCVRERARLASGNEIGFSYTGPGAVPLALRLNELYAIPLD